MASMCTRVLPDYPTPAGGLPRCCAALRCAVLRSVALGCVFVACDAFFPFVWCTLPSVRSLTLITKYTNCESALFRPCPPSVFALCPRGFILQVPTRAPRSRCVGHNHHH